MRPMRVALVSRRFWPLVGGPERIMANLAGQLVARGHEVTVLTTRWHAAWPARIGFRGAAVVRLDPPPQAGWSTARAMMSLARWLRRHRGQYDLVYVSELRHEAYAALGATAAPVALRAERGGPDGDCGWQAATNCGRHVRQRCATAAAALVAPSRAIEEELRAAGYPAPRIHYLPNGVPLPAARTLPRRDESRQALATAHPSLRVAPGAPVALFTGRLQPSKGLDVLVSAWRHIARRWPSARLWLAGDGPARPELERQIRALGLDGLVVPIGSFDHVEELLWAADLFVLPAREAGMSMALLEAMAAGLPIVATDIPGNRALVTHEEHGLLVPPDDGQQLTAAIGRAVADPNLARRLAQAARTRVAAAFSLDECVTRHLTLFESLLQRPSPRRQPSP